MKEGSSSTIIENTIAFEAAKNSLETMCLTCSDGGGGRGEVNPNSLKALQELLKQEQEKNAQLEATVSALTSELKSYEKLVAQLISGAGGSSSKLLGTIKSPIGMEMSDKQQKAMESLQALFKRTCSIEADQVTEDIDEAVELEGRPQINQLEREQSKKRKWRRTGMVKLSNDFRDDQ